MNIGVFIAVVALLQVFTFGLGRSLQWLFAPVIDGKGRRWLMAAAFFVTDGLLAGLLLQLGHFVFRIMAFWMVIMLFVMYAALATFLLYLLLRKALPQLHLSRSLRLFAPLFVAGLLGLGVYNAYTPVVHRQTVTIDKKLDKPLRIGMASDMHLGILFGGRSLDRLAEIMRQEKADIILLPGDLMDDNVEAYRKENMQPHLAKLRAPLGVYATLGNHDLFGDQKEIYEEVTKAGIRVLTNEAVETDNLLIVGRNDDLDSSRPSAAQLLNGKNTNLPVLLLDHRPTEIDIHRHLPVDIQVSGHVHNGQVAPANLIVRALYRLHYGYRQFGRGHFFVTSGYGFWGIPLRLGSQSEVWIIDVKGR